MFFRKTVSTEKAETKWVVEGRIDGGDWLTCRTRPSTALQRTAGGWRPNGKSGKVREMSMDDAIRLALRKRDDFREERLEQRIRNLVTGEIVPVDVLVPSVRANDSA